MRENRFVPEVSYVSKSIDDQDIFGQLEVGVAPNIKEFSIKMIILKEVIVRFLGF